MFLAYVDDLVLVSHDTTRGMEELLQHNRIKLKKDKFAPSHTFLGFQLQLKTLSGCDMWTHNSFTYVNAAIKTIQEALLSRKILMPTKAKNPFASIYHSELDASPELDLDNTRFCQEMVGMLRWAVELGRVDINFEVLLISSHTINPRIGHMNALIHIFAYLNQNPKLIIAFDPRHPYINEDLFI